MQPTPPRSGATTPTQHQPNTNPRAQLATSEGAFAAGSEPTIASDIQELVNTRKLTEHMASTLTPEGLSNLRNPTIRGLVMSGKLTGYDAALATPQSIQDLITNHGNYFPKSYSPIKILVESGQLSDEFASRLSPAGVANLTKPNPKLQSMITAGGLNEFLNNKGIFYGFLLPKKLA